MDKPASATRLSTENEGRIGPAGSATLLFVVFTVSRREG
jgi:hypothetical protein